MGQGGGGELADGDDEVSSAKVNSASLATALVSCSSECTSLPYRLHP